MKKTSNINNINIYNELDFKSYLYSLKCEDKINWTKK